MAHIITHANGKGGVGKTTLNQLTAIILSESQKVLMIDLDPNCCLSQIYGKELSDATSKSLITGSRIKPYNVGTNLDLIPSSLELSYTSNVADLMLKNMLRKHDYMNQYDWIIIDPPGTWNSLTRNAIYSSDRLIVPATLSNLDLEATKKFWEQLDNSGITPDFVVCNRSNNQKNEPGIFDKYKTTFEEFCYPVAISDIKSLKYLTSDPNYPIHPSVKKGLVEYVNMITGGNNAVEQ